MSHNEKINWHPETTREAVREWTHFLQMKRHVSDKYKWPKYVTNRILTVTNTGKLQEKQALRLQHATSKAMQREREITEVAHIETNGSINFKCHIGHKGRRYIYVRDSKKVYID